MHLHPLIAALACLGLSSLAAARGPQLDLPSFAGLQRQATQTVDITLGSLALGVVSGLMDEHDQDSAALKKAVQGLKSVQVRSYQFGSDYVYSRADIDAVRSQLSGPGWSHVTQVRNHKTNDDVDIYVAVDDHAVTGIAIIVSQPREFTIVNVVGSVDFQQVARLQGHLGIPGGLVPAM